MRTNEPEFLAVPDSGPGQDLPGGNAVIGEWLVSKVCGCWAVHLVDRLLLNGRGSAPLESPPTAIPTHGGPLNSMSA
jgi:hypothetical protein